MTARHRCSRWCAPDERSQSLCSEWPTGAVVGSPPWAWTALAAHGPSPTGATVACIAKTPSRTATSRSTRAHCVVALTISTLTEPQVGAASADRSECRHPRGAPEYRQPSSPRRHPGLWEARHMSMIPRENHHARAGVLSESAPCRVATRRDSGAEGARHSRASVPPLCGVMISERSLVRSKPGSRRSSVISSDAAGSANSMLLHRPSRNCTTNVACSCHRSWLVQTPT